MSAFAVVTLVAVAVLLAAIFLAARRRRRRRLLPAGELPPSPFAVELGDIVVVDGTELWLESGWALVEGTRPVGCVWFADGHRLVELSGRRTPLYLTREIAAPGAASLPSTMHHEGAAYERVSRLPVRIEPLGNSPPVVSSGARLGEYRSAAGASLFVVAFDGAARALLGRHVEAQDFERWGGGRATLERP